MTDEPALSKTCSRCGQTFGRDGFYRNRAQKDGLTSQCRDCANANSRAWQAANPERVRERNRQRVVSHRERDRDARLTRLYGVPPGWYAETLAAQENRCAICRQEFTDSRSIHVDHCHRSLRARGLLCRGCNLGIGHFAEDPAALLRAIEYLSTDTLVEWRSSVG